MEENTARIVVMIVAQSLVLARALSITNSSERHEEGGVDADSLQEASVAEDGTDRKDKFFWGSPGTMEHAKKLDLVVKEMIHGFHRTYLLCFLTIPLQSGHPSRDPISKLT